MKTLAMALLGAYISQAMNDTELLKNYFNSNIRSLAKILTRIESREAGFESIMSNIASKKTNFYCLGVTGPPGAGKSTLVDALIHKIRGEGKRVGIVAIDPSSPFSGGAVLGDRIRMQDHAEDPGVFIRSLGSRGSHGGLSRATRDIVRVIGTFGFDVVIVETVGVGQTELDIMELADTTAVILVPEAGDTIQTMKAGLLEIADIFVVNKSDRPGADQITQSLQTLVEMNGETDWTIPVLQMEAHRSQGIDEFYDTVQKHRHFIENDHHRLKHSKEMRDAEVVQITIELFERELKKRITNDTKIKKLAKKTADENENPYSISQKILSMLLSENEKNGK